MGLSFHTVRRFLVAPVVVAVIVCGTWLAAIAADKVKTGDKVKFTHSGQETEGVVKSVTGKLAVIEFKAANGRAETKRLLLSDLTLVESSESGKPDPTPPADEADKKAANKKSSTEPAAKEPEEGESGEEAAEEVQPEEKPAATKKSASKKPESKKSKSTKSKPKENDEDTSNDPDNPFENAADDEGFRTWTDSTGKHRIKAKFVSMDSGVVTLEKPDGKRIKMDMFKLSFDDRAEAGRLWVNQKTDDNPFEGDDADSGSKKGGKKSGGEKGGGESSNGQAAFPYPISKHDPDSLPFKLLGGGGGEYTPDVADVLEPITKRSSIPLSGGKNSKAGFFEDVTNVIVDPVRREAWVSIIDNDPSKRKDAGPWQSFNPCGVVLCDLKNNKTKAKVPLPGSTTVIAVSPSGERLLTTSTDFFGRDRVDVFDWNAKELLHVKSWSVTGENPAARRNFTTGCFVDENHVLVGDKRNGLVVAFNTERDDPEYAIGGDSLGGAAMAFSPHGKYVAVYTKNGVSIVDSLSGEVAKALPAGQGPSFNGSAGAFSKDGTMLAFVSPYLAEIWNIEEGKIVKEFCFPVTGFQEGELVFLDDRYLAYCGNQCSLIDSKKGLLLWKYTGELKKCTVAEGRIVGALKPGNSMFALGAMEMPHAAIAERLKDIESDNLTLIGPGSNFRVNIMAPVSQDEQSQMMSALKDKLRENGQSIDNGGSVTIEVSVRDGEEVKMSYRRFGAGFGNEETVSVRPKIATLEIKSGNEVVWTQTAGGGPSPFLQLKEGQSAQQAVDEQNKINWPGFILGMHLPKILNRHPKEGAFGTTSVSAQGMKDQIHPLYAGGAK